MKYDRVVRNWQIHKLDFTKEDMEKAFPGEGLKPMIMTGTVVEDPTGKFRAGWHMKSSPVKKIDREKGIIITRNSTYKVIDEGNDTIPNLGHGVLNLHY